MIAATAPLPGRVGAMSGRALGAYALRLASGSPLTGVDAPMDDADWAAMLALADRERLAPLAWLRSGAGIAAAAPSDVAAAWRDAWLAACAHAYRALALTGELTRAVERRGGTVVVLKGGPLAHRLYGDVAGRPSTDVDLFAPPACRAAVTRAALELGWVHAEGEAPGDEVFVRRDGGSELFLEVHATLLGERLSFLRLPEPTAARVDVDGVELDAFAGDLLPAYLAAHVATHLAPPLLWWLDWSTLWAGMDGAARDAAARAAGDAGLLRYLRWAERGAAAVAAALEGDADALAALGVRADGSRRDVHQLVRHVTLAPNRRAAATAVREWVRPSWAGERDGGPVTGTLRRVARHWRLLLPSTVSDARPPAPRGARLATAEDVARIRDRLAAAGEVWMPVGGRSMTPTIAAGDSVLLVPAPNRPEPGDIVLNAAGPTPMLHRVTAATEVLVTTRGDACESDDPPAPPAAIVARAIAVRRGSVVAALTPTLRFGVAPLLRFWVRSRRRAAHRRGRPA